MAEIPKDRLEDLRRLPRVRWIGWYRSDYKVHPFLWEVARLVAGERESADQADLAWPTLEINISTLASEDVARVGGDLRKLTVEVLAVHDGRRWGLTRARIIPEAAVLTNIANLSEVQWIEEAVPRKLLNDFAVMERSLNVTNVWVRYGLTGHRQVVAHADTRLDVGAMTNITRISSAGCAWRLPEGARATGAILTAAARMPWVRFWAMEQPAPANFVE